MFIQCDTIKIRTNYKYLLEEKIAFNITNSATKNIEIGRWYNTKHNPSIPFNVYIATNYIHQTLEIEFSSKILLERYPELISKYTIRQCLENLNKLGICTIDVDGVLNNGWVINAHITKDVDLRLTDDVLNSLNQNVSNYRRFKWEHYDHKGITFTKDVVYGKEQIYVYNKYKELLSQSRKFIDSLSNRNEIMDYFDGKTRFEIRLESVAQIKEQLGVSNRIEDFFNAIDSAVREQFDRVFDVTARPLDTSKCKKGWNEWSTAIVLDYFNYNLKRIDQALRADGVFSSRNGHSERMKLCEVLKSKVHRKENEIIRQVRSLL